jgi:hypothetical protein
MPVALPFPEITTFNQGQDPIVKTLQVCYQGQPYRDGIWATLYTDSQAIDQGITDEQGQLQILGALPNDILKVVSQDGTLWAAKNTPLTNTIQMHLDTLADTVLAQRVAEKAAFTKTEITADMILALGDQGLAHATTNTDPLPYLRLWPSGGTSLDGLRLVVDRTTPADVLAYALTGADHSGSAGVLDYVTDDNNFQTQVNFIPPAKAGQARVVGLHQNTQVIDINVDYRLQQANNISQTTIFANDGNLKLFIEPDSLPVNTVHFLTASPWGLPGSLPTGLAIAGEAYELTASANVINLAKPAVLTLRYDQTISETFTNLAIYRWDFGTATWQHLGGSHNLAYREVSTTTLNLGLYALLGTPNNSRSRGAVGADSANEVNPCGPITLPPVNQPPQPPSNPAPANNTTHTATDLSLTWHGGDPDMSDVVTYTVALGQSNPPPITATTTLTSTAVSGLIAGSTYYWQITASDGLSSTVGPIWQFTTAENKPPVNQPPYLPTVIFPTDGLTHTATDLSLTWHGDDPDGDVVTYTVALGQNNPPPITATSTLTSYAVGGLAAGSTYYWQITATDGLSSTVGSVWQFATAANKPPDQRSIYLPIAIK